MKHDFCARYGDVMLRPLHYYDIEDLRRWRNHDDVARYMRRLGHIGKAAQEDWYKKYIDDDDLVFFCIGFKNYRTVGTVALSDISQNNCEIGRIVIGEKEVRGLGIAQVAFLMAMSIGINEFGFQSFKLTVNKENQAARHIYEKIGFEKTGGFELPWGGSEIKMEVSADRFQSINKMVSAVELFKEDSCIVHSLLGGGNALV